MNIRMGCITVNKLLLLIILLIHLSHTSPLTNSLDDLKLNKSFHPSITSAERVTQLHEIVGPEFKEIRQLLDEIRIASLKKHGLFNDQDPTKRIDRQLIRNKLTFDDGTEASINRQISDDLFENDILLTLNQAEDILKEIKQSPNLRRRSGRQAISNTRSFWENTTIPYTFNVAQTNDEWRKSIQNAHRHIEGLTCFRFVHYENERELGNKDYLQYFRGGGCWSQIGRIGGRQPISIGYGCESLGIVAHETLHALGLWHEQSRTDRDNHIRVNFDAVMPGTESNFEKRSEQTVDNMDQPYDLGSTMHYGSKAFSQRFGLSFKDAKMINLRYCSKLCQVQLDCDKGGYTDPQNCEQCRCPDGFAGTYCQELEQSNSNSCRGTSDLTAGEWPGDISTSKLHPGIKCFWRIHPQYSNQSVQLIFDRLNFPCKEACTSYLEVKYKTEKIATGARLCCDLPANIISEVGTEVILILRTDEKLNSEFEGFHISFKSVEGYDKNTTTGIIKPTPTTTTTTTTPKPKANSWTSWGNWTECSATCGACGQRKRVRYCLSGPGKCKGSDYEVERCAFSPCPLPVEVSRCSGRLVMPCELMEELEFGTALNYVSLRHLNGGYSFSINYSILRVTYNFLDINLESSDPNGISSSMIDSNIQLEGDGHDIIHNLLLPRLKNENSIARYRRLTAVRQQRYSRGSKAEKQLCEKRFTYHCPTTLLTISLDFLVERNKREINNIHNEPIHDSRHPCCAGYKLENDTCIKMKGFIS
uniref:Metalloendopeptidase n=1 Tax=Meloidogyne incognita TaxID=6306 RepID=A0A914KR80_MELIC